MSDRMQKFISVLIDKNTFPFLVSDLINIRYLTGFEGSSAKLLIFKDDYYFITDSRYREYAEKILPDYISFVLQDKDINEIIIDLLNKNKSTSLYLEEHSITMSSFWQLQEKASNIFLDRGGNPVNDLRLIKDENEIKVICEAAEITDRCMDHLIKTIKPGITEWDLAIDIEYFFKKNGCKGTAFDSIVASGIGSSMPHYITSNKKIKKGENILFDLGCYYQGYNSDISRTIFVGEPASDLVKIYNIVLSAQQTALSLAKPAMLTGELDKIARDIIDDAGFANCFGHSLGHGVGLEIHELPAVKSGGEIKLDKNMIITIEPGIYMPGVGGVRIEDTVLVTESNAIPLTKFSKSLQIVD